MSALPRVLLTLAVSTALVAPAAATATATTSEGSQDAAARLRSARSHPVEDSYYPRKGDPGVDTLHYGLDLTWHRKARRLDGTATITFRAARTAPDFQLDLAAPLHVDRVAVAPAGTPRRTTTADWSHPGKTLHVHRAVEKNTRYVVRIGYHGSPKPATAPTSRTDMRGVGWHTTKAGQVWAMQEPFGAYTWYPVNDQPSDKALYDVRIDAPGRWVGVSNGKMTRHRSAHGRTITRFTNRDPMASYLMTIAIGPYERHHQRGPHGVPMNYWVPRHHPKLVRPLMHSAATLRWLEHRLGRYPFDRVGIVVTPSDSAMETQTMITLGRTNYRFGVRNVRRTVAHELTHAWYGDTVTPRDWRDVWMNEGMATYFETRWAVAQGWTSWQHWQHEWRRDDGLWREIYGPPGRYHRKRFAGINVYYCTALMLDRLRLKVGTHEFNRLVRRWPQTHRNSNQSRRTFERYWERRTGEELGGFFRTWLMSRRSPAR